jgi:hypothetical protein
MTTDLSALRKVAEVATPGPWDTLAGNKVRAIKGELAVPIFESLAPIDWHKKKNLTHKVLCDAYANEVNNADFIAAANPSVILELLSIIERQKEALGPFKVAADICDSLPLRDDGDTVILVRTVQGNEISLLAVEDLRRARAAMEGIEG